MALSLQSISNKARIRAPRILLIGVEKIGKTSFATGCQFDANGYCMHVLMPGCGNWGMPLPNRLSRRISQNT